MAASKHLPTGQFDSVMLLADPKHAALLEPIVAKATGANVATSDPTALLTSGLTIDDLPASGPRLAAVAGAVAMPGADKATVLDFKNPKKRPPKKSNRKTFILAGAAVALLALGGISWWYWTNADLDQQLSNLLIEKEEKTKQREVAAKRSGELAEVEQFLAQSPNWLDELTYISSKIPPADKVQISGAQFFTGPQGQSQIQITSVIADSAESLDEFEESLRDDYHDVNSINRQSLPQPIGRYNWAASPTTVQLIDRGWTLDSKIEELMRAGRDTQKSETPADKDEPARTDSPSEEADSKEAEPGAGNPPEDAQKSEGNDSEVTETDEAASPEDAESEPADESEGGQADESSEGNSGEADKSTPPKVASAQ
jgi:hypothetical protein